MKRKKLIILLAIVTATMAGCGTKINNSTISDTAVDVQDSVQSAAEDNDIEEITEEIEVKDISELSFSERQSSTIKESGKFLYFIGNQCIYKVDKTTMQGSMLWKSDGLVESDNMFNGSGIILGDKLYFIEDVADNQSSVNFKCVLSVINTDGSGYQKGVVDSSEDSFSQIFYSEGVLYISGYCSTVCYKVEADGTLGEKIPNEETVLKYIPEDYSELSYNNGSYRNLTAPETAELYGYALMHNSDYDIVKVDAATGEETAVALEDMSIVGFNKDSIFALESEDESGEGGYNLCRIDASTFEKTVIRTVESYLNPTVFTDNTLYYVETKTNEETKNTEYVYNSISLENGEIKELFTLHGVDSSDLENDAQIVGYFSPEYSLNMMVLNNYLYYADMKDYKAYLMRRNIDKPDEENVLGDAYYDTGISKVGKLKSYVNEYYSKTNPDILLETVKIYYLAVNDGFKGADLINETLYKAEVEEPIAYVESNLESTEEWATQDNTPATSYESTVCDIDYFDGKYVSFTQDSYDYQGGAHGMPVWTAYTFDLETGDRLELTDIISNDEEYLKDIVTKYFAQMINSAPEGYWEDSESYVRERITLDFNNFYLTDSGIVFYLEPYEIAPYAGGFQQVTVSYKDFDLKIEFKR